MIVLSIIMPPGVAPVYNRVESWAISEEPSIAFHLRKREPGRAASKEKEDPQACAKHIFEEAQQHAEACANYILKFFELK